MTDKKKMKKMTTTKPKRSSLLKGETMSNKRTKILAVSITLVMPVRGIALCITGHLTNSESFCDNSPSKNLTADHYKRMPINDAGHFST
jgi:hypothetical protein